MKKIFRENKKYTGICAITAFFVCLLILFYRIAAAPKAFFASLANFFSSASAIFGPVIFGLIIAYLLHHPANSLIAAFAGSKVFAKFKNRGRSLAVLIVTVLALALIVLFIYALIPNTVESIVSLFEQLTTLKEPFQKFLTDIQKNDTVIWLMDVFNIKLSALNDSNFYSDLLAKGQSFLETAGGSVFSFAVDTGKFFYNFVIGFIIAVYINLDWPALKRQGSKLVKALFPRRYERMAYICRLSDNIFSRYIIGKLISSSILGLICVILCLIFRVRYAVLIGVIVAVTNLVPIFGPWVGTVLCALFAFLSGFKQSITVVIIILIAQQLENNIVQPKVLGGIVNLSGFWVFVSVILAGSIGGVTAMVISIPVFSILKTLIGEWIQDKIKRDDVKHERDKAPAVAEPGGKDGPPSAAVPKQ